MLRKKEATFLYSVALIPIFITAIPSAKVNQTYEDSQNRRFPYENAVMNPNSEYDNLNWTVKKFCANETGVNVCMEVGIPSDGRQYPRTLRIARDLRQHQSYRKVKRQYDDNNYRDENDYGEQTQGQDYQDLSQGSSNKNDEDDSFYDYQDDKNTCQVSKDVKTAEIRCKIWPSSVACKSYCIYGSTFREGIVRTHKCLYKENRWSTPFEECRPFVDCGVKLRSPGTIKCIRNEVERPPACQISCEIYEDKDEVKNQVSTCKANGQWEPALPFCAERRGGHQVPAPHVREHSGLAYP